MQKKRDEEEKARQTENRQHANDELHKQLELLDNKGMALTGGAKMERLMEINEVRVA